MNADNRETIASVILLHKQKEFRSIFELFSISLNDSNLKKSYHELVRRVHSNKNGTNPGSTLAQQNLADAYAFLHREKEIEIERETEKEYERERERNKIRVEQREEKRKRENEFNKKREKERRERYEVRDSYTSESYSDDSSIGSLLLKGRAKRQHQKNAAMEEKRKKLVAKKNELEMLAKKMVSMRKRSKGSDWYS